MSNTVITNQQLFFHNEHERLLETNFYETELCKKGAMICSINANCFRIILPPDIAQNGDFISSKKILREIRTGKRAIFRVHYNKFGRAMQFMFDDDTEFPYSLILHENQIIPFPTLESMISNRGVTVKVYVMNENTGIMFEAASFDAEYQE